MADRISLGMIGLLFGAATFAVMVIGAMVVTDHLSGKMHLDDGIRAMSLPVPPTTLSAR